MAQVSVQIAGFTYTIECEDGQEAHLRAMAAQVSSRVASIKALGGQSGEARLLVLAALLIADELHDLTIEANSLRSIRHQPGAPAALPALPDPMLADRLQRLAALAEQIADQCSEPA